MKNAPLVDYLDREAMRFKAKATEHAYAALKKGDGLSINEKDARLIRDHEIRSETFKEAARIAAGHGEKGARA